VSDQRGGPAETIGAAIARFLAEHGHTERVKQMAVLAEWPAAAGPQIARVTEAVQFLPDRTLVVAVATHAWMTELSLHEPTLLAQLNAGFDPPRVARIRWQLRR
jgi:predicted nucleic acid-binding Zn ribbon protein